MKQENILTIIFVDISKSTALYETYGDVEAEKTVNHTLSIVSDLLSKYEGKLIKTIGDGLMGTFPNAEIAIYAACEMQEMIRQDPFLLQKNIAIKIGLHFGEVLWKDNDIFGDAVNTAARMVDIAKADQIITTRSVVEKLPSILASNTLTLGPLHVKGKQDNMEIFEMIWQGKQADLTIMASNIFAAAPELAIVKLTLNYQDKQFQITEKSRSFSLGRNSGNDLVIKSAAVSRSHASIECRQGKFVLSDSSTNGTHVKMESGEKFYVHREDIHLHGQGIICLGKDIEKNSDFLIRFECK